MRWALALGVLCGTLAALPEAVGHGLALERQAVLLHGEVWRLWTAHLVHFSAAHACADLLLLVPVSAIAEGEWGAGRLGWAMLAGAPLISAGLLLLLPGLAWYQGSSALVFLIGTLAVTGLWRRAPRWRPMLGGMVALAVAKMVLDAGDWLPELSSLPPGIQTVWQAHVLGVACALAWLYGCRRRAVTGMA